MVSGAMVPGAINPSCGTVQGVSFWMTCKFLDSKK